MLYCVMPGLSRASMPYLVSFVMASIAGTLGATTRVCPAVTQMGLQPPRTGGIST